MGSGTRKREEAMQGCAVELATVELAPAIDRGATGLGRSHVKWASDDRGKYLYIGPSSTD